MGSEFLDVQEFPMTDNAARVYYQSNYQESLGVSLEDGVRARGPGRSDNALIIDSGDTLVPECRNAHA